VLCALTWRRPKTDGLLALAAQHELAKMAFYKPWTAGGASAVTASTASAGAGSSL